MTTELEWSEPGNRHWADVVPTEGVGEVTVSTCRPWPPDVLFDDEELVGYTQAPYYETLIFWGPEVAGRQSLIVDHYATEQTALSGHRYWELPKVIAQTLVELKAGEFEESTPGAL